VLGFYFVEDADFAGLAVGILIDAEIFLGHLVDVSAGALFGDLDDAAADFKIAVRIFRIDEGERDAGIAANILVFLTALGGVENDVLAVEIAPDGLAKARFWNRSRYFSGMTADIKPSLRSCVEIDRTL
jgi:hypothetical protein